MDGSESATQWAELALGAESRARLRAVESAAQRGASAFPGGQLAWWSWGAPGTAVPILLFPGGFGSWRHWFHNVLPLSRRHPVHCIELPGLGDSDQPASADPDKPTVTELADAVVSGIELRLGAEPVHLVGFSFGGIVAAETAARLGPRARSLVFSGSAALGLPLPRVPRAERIRPEMSPAELAAAHRHNLATLMLHDPAAIDDLALYLEHESVRRARLRYTHILGTDAMCRSLARCRAPVTSIWGAHDPFHGGELAARAERLATLVPEPGFHVIEGASHWVMYERPEICDALVLETLARADAAT